MTVAGITIEVERKKIKHTHLAVYPPDARVHVSAPIGLPDSAVRSYVASKIDWIREQRNAVLAQPRQSRREYVSGESIYCLGRRYRLAVEVQGRRSTETVLWGGNKLTLHVREGASRAHKEKIIESWQKAMLYECTQAKLKSWCARLGRVLPLVGIRKMKTRWASCVQRRNKIVFNTALARVPVKCIEYVIVHDLTHFEVANHSETFVRLMDERLPRWRILRKELNDFIAAPVDVLLQRHRDR